MAALRLLFLVIFTFLTLVPQNANSEITTKILNLINNANRYGPYLGVVIPNQFEMNPLLQHPSYKPSNVSAIDFAGRRFRFGTIAGQPVVLVMSGLAMLNAGTTTQLLLTLFRVEGVVHYGIAGNANSNLNVGDVTIPLYWSHSGLWSWQRYGDGPENELPLEGNGDYTRKIGYLRIADYAINVGGCNSNDNLLNNVWYQPEEIFPEDGTPEERQHIFWVPVDSDYYRLSKKLEGLELEKCTSTICLLTRPKVVREFRGTSASIYLDNAAYGSSLYDKFKISPVDMESAAVALISYQQNVPFITFRALSSPPGRGSAADTFTPLAVSNAVAVVVEFIKLFGGLNSKPFSM